MFAKKKKTTQKVAVCTFRGQMTPEWLEVQTPDEDLKSLFVTSNKSKIGDKE